MSRPRWMPLKYAGMSTNRFKQNPREKMFAKAWANMLRSGGPSLDTLDYVLSDDNNSPVPCSERDRRVANTVIQWLGSPIGWRWLTEVMSEIEDSGLDHADGVNVERSKA